MKKLFLLAAMLLGFAGTPAHALCTVNTVPMVGLICDIARSPTYSATAVGLVPVASATDLFCISAGTAKNISIRRITIGGTAGTAVTTPFLIYQRSALDTAGTSPTGLPLPVPVSQNSADPASTATLVSYTANPSVAATPVLLDAMVVDLPVTTATNAPPSVTQYYGTQVDNFDKGLDILKGTTNQVCVNLNGVTVTTGTLVIHMEWTENP